MQKHRKLGIENQVQRLRSILKALQVISKSVDPPKYKVRFRGEGGTEFFYSWRVILSEN